MSDDPKRYPALASFIGGKLNTKLILAQWPEVQRLVTSIKQGTVTASLMLRKLASYPRQNSLALALHIDRMREKHAASLFEASWKKLCSDRHVRRMLERYPQVAGIECNVSLHQLRHFLLAWLKTGHRRHADPTVLRPSDPATIGDLLTPGD